MPFSSFTAEVQQRLLELAEGSIRHGLERGRPLPPPAATAPLGAPGACFVTLHRHDQLRGCIGSLEPRRPLVEDVVLNAYHAAFSDPRFAPLSAVELTGLSLHISVLGPLEPVAACSEAALLAFLQPGVHGLVLEGHGRRATFLPAVWEQLPEPRVFLGQLKRKAGLPAEYWSQQLRFWSYRVLEFGGAVRAPTANKP